MKVSDFNFDLPEQLIAKNPTKNRVESRLLHLNGVNGDITHAQFLDIEQLIQPGDLLVFNNTRVIPARLRGKKASGGKVEVLIERVLDDHHALAHIKASKAPKAGTVMTVEDAFDIEMLSRESSLFKVRFLSDKSVFDLLDAHGHMPLPPYIDRPDNDADKERYQTVYNKTRGAVAAPTAGLHFDEPLLQRLKQKGVNTAFVTLHVGAGTFQPVRVEHIEEHQMHAEYAIVDQSVVEAVLATKAAGKRVIAVGTTSVRSLESAARKSMREPPNALIAPFMSDTNIFIYPGIPFIVVDAMVTNFHLPESTLMMLISAFAGTQNVMKAYQHAIEHEYRFFSYGDAMFIEKQP